MTRSRTKSFLLTISVYLVVSLHAAHATTVVELTFTDLVGQAGVITVGTVSDIHEQWDVSHNAPLTLVTFSNLTVLKGNPGSTLTLEFLGGTMPNGLIMVIAGVPRFRVGERTVVFRSGNQHEFCPLMGVWQGLLRVVTDPQSGVETVSDSFWLPIMRIQNGTFVKQGPKTVSQERLSLPILLQSIQHLLQHPAAHS